MSEIRPSDQLTSRTTGQTAAGSRSAAFRIGQIVEGRIVSTPEGNRLQVGDRQLPLRGNVQPPLGTRLTLEVVQLRPAPDMRILEQRLPGQSGGADTGRIRLAAESLASQLDTRQILQTLRSIQTLAPLSEGKRLGQLNALRQALAPLLLAVNRGGELTRPEGLQQAIRDSGLFTENRLLNLPASSGLPDSMARDWKIALGKSLVQIRQASRDGRLPPITIPQAGTGGRQGAFPPPPPGSGWNTAAPAPQSTPLQGSLQSAATGQQGQMLRELPEALRIIVRQIEGAMGRSELHQAASATAESESGRTQLWFELPVFRQQGEDLWQFWMRRNAEKSEKDGDSWTVTLAVHLAELGPFYAEIKLRGDRVSARLYAEQADTVERLRRDLGNFRERLQAQNLTLDQLGVSMGSPPAGLSALPARAWRSEA